MLPGSGSCFSVPFVIKSLDTVLLREGKDCLFTYTILNAESDLSDRTVRSAPLLAQRLLNSKTDLRVTVVGNEVFAVRILSNGRGIREDWRTVPREEVEFQPIALSSELARSCLLLVVRLGPLLCSH